MCLESSRAVHTARSILKHCLVLYPGKKKLWFKLIELEKENSSHDEVAEVLKNAMEKANNNVILVLSYAKHIWKKLDNPSKARDMLEQEFVKNPESELLCLGLQKLIRIEGKDLQKAEKLLTEAI